MEFCENCDNMLYTRIVRTDTEGQEEPLDETTEQLTYFCRCCGNTKDNIKKTTSSIYSINFNTDNIKKQFMINPYTFDDPTLPKATGIKCPNKNCPSKTPNIIYINYDENDMKYIYICLDCHKNKIEPHMW